jgi:glycosyltransferase involved in cell wall biosynthesis
MDERKSQMKMRTNVSIQTRKEKTIVNFGDTDYLEQAISSPHISVIIPALNEARNLPHVLPYIPDIVDEIILVDGHSVDDTIAVARSLLPGIKIVQQSGKGKGNALRCGFEASTGDIIVMMDADGSTEPREIPRFVQALREGADFAKGSRFIDGGGSADITGFRHLGNQGLHLIVNQLFHLRFTDLCYGYNAFWKDCLNFFEVDCDGFEVEALINVRVCKAGLKMVEVPSYEHKRIYGASNLRAVRDGWRVLKIIMKEWLNGHSVIKANVPSYSEQPDHMLLDPQAIGE